MRAPKHRKPINVPWFKSQNARQSRTRTILKDFEPSGRLCPTESKFNKAHRAATIYRFQLVSIRPLRPARRSENIFGLQPFHQLACPSAPELGLGYAMPRVIVNRCVIMVGKKPPTVYHFDSVRFHLEFQASFGFECAYR